MKSINVISLQSNKQPTHNTQYKMSIPVSHQEQQEQHGASTAPHLETNLSAVPPPVETMTLRQAFRVFYQSDPPEIEDAFERDEVDELFRLWRLELRRLGMRIRPAVDSDPPAETPVARTALAFALHGLQAYMVRRGWQKIDRSQEMGLTYITAGELNRMRKEGRVPDLG